MKNIFLGIILGLFIGFLLFYEREKNERSTQSNRQLISIGPQVDKENSRVKKESKIEKKNLKNRIHFDNELKPINPNESTTNQNNSYSINIDFTENQIFEIEQRISELQGDIAFYRDNKGWSVHMNTDSNLFTEIGIKNNDFIRFEQVENMKMNFNSNLAYRLEDIIKKLER